MYDAGPEDPGHAGGGIPSVALPCRRPRDGRRTKLSDEQPTLTGMGMVFGMMAITAGLVAGEARALVDGAAMGNVVSETGTLVALDEEVFVAWTVNDAVTDSLPDPNQGRYLGGDETSFGAVFLGSGPVIVCLSGADLEIYNDDTDGDSLVVIGKQCFTHALEAVDFLAVRFLDPTGTALDGDDFVIPDFERFESVELQGLVLSRFVSFRAALVPEPAGGALAALLALGVLARRRHAAPASGRAASDPPRDSVFPRGTEHWRPRTRSPASRPRSAICRR